MDPVRRRSRAAFVSVVGRREAESLGEEVREAVGGAEAARLGLNPAAPFSLEFKWSDNLQSDTVDDFYVNGDAAPRGRVNWRFDFEPR